MVPTTNYDAGPNGSFWTISIIQFAFYCSHVFIFRLSSRIKLIFLLTLNVIRERYFLRTDKIIRRLAERNDSQLIHECSFVNAGDIRYQNSASTVASAEIQLGGGTDRWT